MSSTNTSHTSETGTTPIIDTLRRSKGTRAAVGVLGVLLLTVAYFEKHSPELQTAERIEHAATDKMLGVQVNMNDPDGPVAPIRIRLTPGEVTLRKSPAVIQENGIDNTAGMVPAEARSFTVDYPLRTIGADGKDIYYGFVYDTDGSGNDPAEATVWIAASELVRQQVEQGVKYMEVEILEPLNIGTLSFNPDTQGYGITFPEVHADGTVVDQVKMIATAIADLGSPSDK